MSVVVRFVRRVVPADWRDSVERDLRDEAQRRGLPSHRTDAWVAWQMVRVGAAFRWHRRRGGLGFAGDSTRARGHWPSAAATCLRDAWRGPRSAPTTTGVALLILTTAIAAATVTFSVVDAVVLRSLPFEDSDRIVMFGPDTSRVHSEQEFAAWREHSDTLAAVAVTIEYGPLIQVGVPDVFAYGRAVETTADLFEVLQVQPQVGRAFSIDNETPGQHTVAVISHHLWQREFGGRPEAIGRTLRLVKRAQSAQSVRETAELVQIIGIMPAGFTWPIDGSPRHVWIPHVARANARPDFRSLPLVGRLRREVTVEEAQVQLGTIKRSVAAAHGIRLRGDGPQSLVTLQDYLLGDLRGSMLLALVAAILLMLVASVNVASLMLTRITVRGRALAVRASLGASSWQIATSLVAEGVLLALGAAAGGLVLAVWGIEAAKTIVPPASFRADTIALDLRVLTVALSTAVASGVFFGLVPAWYASRVQPAALLNQTTPVVMGHAGRWRGPFLAAEVTLVSALLVISTMFVASFVRIVRWDLGFARSDLVAIQNPDFRGDATPLLEALREVPGVEAVAESSGVPPLLVAAGDLLSYSVQRRRLSRTGAAELSSGSIEPTLYRVSPAYFPVAGIALRQGRLFGEADATNDVAIVDEQTADFLVPDGADPVGFTLPAEGSAPALRIVGIVATVASEGPESGMGAQIYLPKRSGAPGTSHFLIRLSRPAPEVTPAILATVKQALPAAADLPPVLSVDDAFRSLTAGRRANATIMSLFGLVVLLIGAAGVYAVMASTVAQQQRELGVRVALGATRARIMRTVLGRAAVYLMLGLAVGLAAGRALSTMFASMLFEVRPGDVSTYAIVAALLLTAGLIAALRPALRAAQVDPIVTLRAE